MSTEIRVREEDGAMIFEKDKMNDLEMKFYNPEYFAMIGFSDAEIKMINKTDGSEVGDGASEQPPPDSMAAENGSVEQPPDSMAAENGSEEPPPDSMAAENGSIEQPPDSMAAENGSVEPPPDSMAAENGSIEQPPDSMAAENGSEEPPPDSMDAENGSMEQPPDSMATENGSVEQPPDSMAVENGSGEQQESGDQARNEMKGGYYKNVRILTVPFRHFVYFVQGRGKEPDQTTTESDKSQTFFTGFSSIFDKIRGTFNNSNAPTEKDNQSNTLEPTPSTLAETDVNQVSQDGTQSSADALSIMWVVKIPIIKEELGIHENEERELNQIIIEHRAEKTNNIIVTGERYLIGSRSIKMANTVEEGISTVQFPESNLVGTKMHKYAKLNNSGTSNKSGLFGVFY
jgi:hypothetical protein